MPAVSAKCTNSNTAGSTCSSSTAFNNSNSFQSNATALSNRGGQLSSSSNCIKTISSYVSNNYNSLSSPSLSLASKQQKPMSKCPHVVLIGDIYAHDLDPDYRRQVQIKKQVISFSFFSPNAIFNFFQFNFFSNSLLISLKRLFSQSIPFLKAINPQKILN